MVSETILFSNKEKTLHRLNLYSDQSSSTCIRVQASNWELALARGVHNQDSPYHVTPVCIQTVPELFCYSQLVHTFHLETATELLYWFCVTHSIARALRGHRAVLLLKLQICKFCWHTLWTYRLELASLHSIGVETDTQRYRLAWEDDFLISCCCQLEILGGFRQWIKHCIVAQWGSAWRVVQIIGERAPQLSWKWKSGI